MSPGHEQLDAPTDRMLRQFAACWIVVFVLIAAVQEAHYGRRSVALALLLLATTVGPIGLVRPRAIRRLFVGWTTLARPVGWMVSNVLLRIVFYGVFTPVALIFRIMRRDALGVRRQTGATSYWRTRPSARDSASCLRQF